MDGQVAMHVKVDGEEQIIMLNAGDIFYAGVGCEHVAHPQGAARILVIEKEGSVCPRGGRFFARRFIAHQMRHTALI